MLRAKLLFELYDLNVNLYKTKLCEFSWTTLCWDTPMIDPQKFQEIPRLHSQIGDITNQVTSVRGQSAEDAAALHVINDITSMSLLTFVDRWGDQNLVRS